MLSDAERFALIDRKLRHGSMERLEEIGRGGRATVHRVYDRGLNRDAAIKVWSHDPQGGVEADDPSWDRKRAVARATHGNIVPIYALDASMGWVIMELLTRNLRPEFAEGPMSFDRARFVLRQVLKALAHLHERCGLLHGAIKPTNILIDAQGTVKLGDALGIPLLESSSTIAQDDLPALMRAITGVGPPTTGDAPRHSAGKYLAPETINPEFGPVGQWVDQYCLGIAVLELLIGPQFEEQFPGVGPEAADPELAWMRWHGSDSRLPPVRDLVEGIPPDLAAVLDRLCQKRVDARFPAVPEALHNLKGPNPGTPIRSASQRGGVPAPRDNLPGRRAPNRGDGFARGPVGPQAATVVRNPFHPEEPEPWSAGWFKDKLREPKLRRNAVAALAVMPLLLGLLAFSGMRPKRQVRIESSPEGAVLVVDGSELPGKTPILCWLVPGEIIIEFTKDGYRSARVERVVVQPGEGVQRFGPYTLDPVRRTVSIQTSLPGARVFLDGQDMNVTTPAVISIPIGEHTIDLKKPGYQPILALPIECKEGDGVMNLGPFDLALKDRPVKVVSDPPARIYLNGANTRTVTPALHDLPVGTHRLKLVLEGYRDREITLEVTPGDSVQEPEAYRLEPVVRTVKVAVTSSPPGADVLIQEFGGRKVIHRLRTPGEVQLSPGTSWMIHAALPGQREISEELVVGQDQGHRSVHLDFPARQRIINAIGMELVWIPPGEFVMGAGHAAFEDVRILSLPPSGPGAAHPSPGPWESADLWRAPSLGPGGQTQVNGLSMPMAGIARPRVRQAPAIVKGPAHKKDRESDDADERPRHLVKITRSFWIGKCEVTQEQYERVMGVNPGHHKPGAVAGVDDARNHPVESVSFDDAVMFCNRLARQEGLPQGTYRLPHEAEWEYVARGRPAHVPRPDDPAIEGWLEDNSGRKTRPVGRHGPNAFGVHDMIGNVAEWTEDWYDPGYYAESPVYDPAGPRPLDRKKERVVRGGSFKTRRDSFRITDRDSCPPASNDRKTIGFRVVRLP